MSDGTASSRPAQTPSTRPSVCRAGWLGASDPSAPPTSGAQEKTTDRIIEDGEKLGPKDRAERVALFRVQVIGPLLARDFQDHGELADEIRAIATKWHRPPESALGRQYSAPTIERWYYAYKRGGLDALRPPRRSDMGHARELTAEQRALLLDIRREHPRATASLILRTLELDGRVEKGAVSPSTLRRLYREHGLERANLDAADGRVRLRWQADRADALALRRVPRAGHETW